MEIRNYYLTFSDKLDTLIRSKFSTSNVNEASGFALPTSIPPLITEQSNSNGEYVIKGSDTEESERYEFLNCFLVFIYFLLHGAMHTP